MGTWAQRGCVLLSLMCLPIGCLWVFGTAPMLRLLGIDEDVAALSALYCRINLLGLWPVLIRGANPGTEILQGWPKLWANFRALIGIFSQSVVPSVAIWANPVQFFV